MTLYADDRAPKYIDFPITLGSIPAASVDSITCVVRKPDGVFVEWELTLPADLTATPYVASYTLLPNGTSLGQVGKFVCRAFLYAAGGALLGETLERGFDVKASRVRRPL